MCQRQLPNYSFMVLNVWYFTVITFQTCKSVKKHTAVLNNWVVSHATELFFKDRLVNKKAISHALERVSWALACRRRNWGTHIGQEAWQWWSVQWTRRQSSACPSLRSLVAWKEGWAADEMKRWLFIWSILNTLRWMSGLVFVASTFFWRTSCQLMELKNLCVITSLASSGLPPSL